MADPLEALLRPVANILSRNIAESTPARELCTRLAGRTVEVHVRDTSLAMYFRFDSDSVSLAGDCAANPDVVITGSLLTLGRLALSGADGINGLEGIELAGNATSARAFQDLLAYAKPDPEEELSRVVGDTAAHELGESYRALRRWAIDARSTLHDNIREYLQEEGRELPSRYEIERFTRSVNALRDDVARLEARLNRLEKGT